jgi:hypothetical protein
VAITLKDNPAEDTQTELQPGRSRERDEFQTAVDKTVEGLVGTDNTYRYTVAKADKSDMKKIVRRATDLHKQIPVWFKDQAHDDGTVTVKFRVQPKPAKTEANGQAEQSADAEQQAEAEAQSGARGGRFSRR